MSKSILILASGSGSNAQAICDYFRDSNSEIKIAAIGSNRPKAGVLERAKRLNIPSLTFNRNQFQSNELLDRILSLQPDLIVLAGFLWKIPSSWVQAFPNQIINIHPALLPNYGGKGMYGMNVHQAVFDDYAKKSGITIHYVNEAYDKGAIILQKSVTLTALDTPPIIRNKVLELEHYHYPRVIIELLQT